MIYLMLALIFLSISLTQAYYFWKLKEVKKKASLLIEAKVDEVIDTLKGEIPMASTFLSGALDQKLRLKAKKLVGGLLSSLEEGEKDLSLKLLLIPHLLGFLLFLLAFLAISMRQ